jgi:hypothetical protein
MKRSRIRQTLEAIVRGAGCLGSLLAILATASGAAAEPFADVLGHRSSGPGLVTVVDTATLAKVTAIPVGNRGASIPLPSLATSLALTPDGGTLYAARLGPGCSSQANGFVTIIDTHSNAALGSVEVGVAPYTLDVAPDGQRVFVANWARPHPVSVISRATQTVIGSFTGGQYMTDIAFAPDGLRAFAPWAAGGAVLDAVTNTLAGSIAFDPSTEGAPIGIAIPSSPPSDRPTDVFASIAAHEVTLHWRPPQAAGPLTGYVVEGGLAPGQVLASLPTGSVLPMFRFAAPSGVFYVRVHAVLDGVRGDASDEIRIAVRPPMPPGAPEGLVGLVNGSSIALTWRNSMSAGVATAIALDVTGSLTTQLMLPAGETFSFANVPPGTYTLAVRGVNGFGASDPSNSVTLSFPAACTGPPLAPSDVRIYKGGAQLYVYWSPAATGPAPTSYVLRVSGSYTGAFPTTGRALNGTVGPGTYSLSVAAANPCGEGPASLPETVDVP